MCGEPHITLVIIRLSRAACKEDRFAFMEFIIHLHTNWGIFLIGIGVRGE
jgi:hypothetical protein